ncbi:Ureohydrolase, partial [Aspergillus ellipticus CBS 707.79]
IGTVTGTASAMRERLPCQDLAAIWIDAHADINTPATSLSGRIHGMPVAFAAGIAPSPPGGVFGWIEERNLIDFEEVL